MATPVQRRVYQQEKRDDMGWHMINGEIWLFSGGANPSITEAGIRLAWNDNPENSQCLVTMARMEWCTHGNDIG